MRILLVDDHPLFKGEPVGCSWHRGRRHGERRDGGAGKGARLTPR